MRLWSLHPRSLDKAGLGAVWREGLLARKVLLGETRGYKNHSQLERFKACVDPVVAIDAYLHVVQWEATRRSYHYNVHKLGPNMDVEPIPLSTGQLAFELEHLRKKVEQRKPEWLPQVVGIAHPLFTLRKGPIEPWERT